MKQWSSFAARINRATLRERVLLFAGVLSVLTAIWYQMILTPVLARQTAVAQALDQIHRNSLASGSTAALDGAAEAYVSLKNREAVLSQAIAETEAALNDAQIGMVAPRDMMVVLTGVLHEQKDLSLVLLRNLPVEPLLPAPPDATPAPAAAAASAAGTTAGAGGAVVGAAGAGPYLHPVELVVRGGYLNVLSYLKALEAKPQGFQWRRFELSTTDSGIEYRIEFTTVSMESNWLGV